MPPGIEIVAALIGASEFVVRAIYTIDLCGLMNPPSPRGWITIDDKPVTAGLGEHADSHFNWTHDQPPRTIEFEPAQGHRRTPIKQWLEPSPGKTALADVPAPKPRLVIHCEGDWEP